MSLLSTHSVTHVSYVLLIYSVAFLMYLFVNILLHIYAQAMWPDDDSNGLRPHNTPMNGQLERNQSIATIGAMPGSRPMSGAGGRRSGWHSRKTSTASHHPGGHRFATYSDTYTNGNADGPLPPSANGGARLPRHRGTHSQQVRDVEEFELEGLMSEPETDDETSPTDSARGRKKEVMAV